MMFTAVLVKKSKWKGEKVGEYPEINSGCLNISVHASSIFFFFFFFFWLKKGDIMSLSLPVGRKA